MGKKGRNPREIITSLTGYSSPRGGISYGEGKPLDGGGEEGKGRGISFLLTLPLEPSDLTTV